MTLPSNFAWLANEPGPRMLAEALKLFGTREVAGTASNPVILAWRDEIAAVSQTKKIGVSGYANDGVAWCGLFMAIVALRAGKDFPDHPLWARNWSGFGEKAVPEPMLGDVLVFERAGGAGHVALYAGENSTHFFTLGGNQGDAVSIVEIEKVRLLSARRPFFKLATPTNIRRVVIDVHGPVSTNEA